MKALIIYWLHIPSGKEYSTTLDIKYRDYDGNASSKRERIVSGLGGSDMHKGVLPKDVFIKSVSEL